MVVSCTEYCVKFIEHLRVLTVTYEVLLNMCFIGVITYRFSNCKQSDRVEQNMSNNNTSKLNIVKCVCYCVKLNHQHV